jgi:UDP-glucose 4-epimerase
VVLRYFNVFGPFQSPFSQYAAVVPLFISAIAKDEPITIFGDGGQSRDFTYVDNVVDATLRAANAPDANGQIINIAAAAPSSVDDLADAIGRIMGKDVHKRNLPPRTGDIRDSWADISRARNLLGYEPSVGLDEGLRRTVEAFGV